MALYHMLNVVGGYGGISWYSLCRCVRKETHNQIDGLHKAWNNRTRHALLLSSSLIVLRGNERHRRTRITVFKHAELSPRDAQDNTFNKLDMRLLEELRDVLPSSSETLEKIEEAKQKISELAQRLNSDPLVHKIREQASINTDLIAETLSDTISETKEAFQNITQRLVKSPEPAQPIHIDETVNRPNIDIELTQDIIDQTRSTHSDDVELVPRIKAAVRQFKAEIAADESGDPPISLVSRKAKERIEQFIKSRRDIVQIKKSEHLDIVKSKDISFAGDRPPDESIMEYITSNVPDCNQEDPELQVIMLDTAGTFYNDAFLVDDNIEIEDTAVLVSDGWNKEIAQPYLTIWKKPLPDENLSLYKIFGSFDSISAVEFYNAQVNDQYRSIWDKSVSSLYVIDNITNNREIVYWATKFPFPLGDRDYVFERTHSMNGGRIEISSRSITHKSKPEQIKYVRVYKYGSKLVITATGDPHQKGMSYVLTYYDDCGTPIPAQVKDCFANTKIPEFLSKVHEAAAYLGKTGKLYVPYPDTKRKP